MADKKINDMKFEEAMERLEKIVKLLDSGSASLDDSIAAFEEGIALVKLCNSKLAGAEQKVKILVAGADGNVTEQSFAGTAAQ